MAREKTVSSFQDNVLLLSQLDLISLFDSMTFGMLFIDPDRRVIAINRYLEALTGYGREDVFGVPGENVIRSNLSNLGDPVGEALESDKTMILEGDIINQSRKINPIRFTITPLKLTSGKMAGAMILLEDISLLKDLDSKIHGFADNEKIIGHSRKMQEIFENLNIRIRELWRSP